MRASTSKEEEQKPTVLDRELFLPKRWIFILALLPIGLWYVAPQLGEITVANYIRDSFAKADSFEGWAVTGKWQSLAKTLPTPTRRSTQTPTPNTTTTPEVDGGSSSDPESTGPPR